MLWFCTIMVWSFVCKIAGSKNYIALFQVYKNVPLNGVDKPSIMWVLPKDEQLVKMAAVNC